MSLETTIFDMGVTDTTPEVKEEKKPQDNSIKAKSAPKPRTKVEEKPIFVQGDWVIHFPTESFEVSDFVEEIPEAGVTLEEVRQGIERHFPKFSAARTRWDVDEENKRLFPDAFAGSKGMITLGEEGRFAPSFFNDLSDALASDKKFRYLLSNDGMIYALYQSVSGLIIVPAEFDDETRDKIVTACGYQNFSQLPGKFTPTFEWHLPKIPNKILRQIVGFFRSYVMESAQYEVALRVYWDNVVNEFIVDCPKQTVTPVLIHFEQMEQYAGVNALRYIPVLEIHSHNVMRAFFSSTDDENEQSFNTTFGVFGVFGRLNREAYEMVFRAKMKDQALEIQVNEIFELNEEHDDYSFPQHWNANVKVKDGFYL
ncbi:MAG: hypothetical protein KBT36_01565 [Kurthia sp.]|nr:hypothetical protein [Candidatus Kurthia equi]